MFDGVKETAVFPGDLPEDARAAVAQGRPPIGPDDVRFVRFRPPRVSPPGADGEYPAAPHIRLDRAIEFLIGDRLE